MTARSAGSATEADRVERFRRARRDPELAVLEGFHAVKHSLRFGAALVDLASPDPAHVLELARRLAPDLVDVLDEAIVPVGGEAWTRLAPVPPATGLLAIARRPPVDLSVVLADPRPAPVVLLDRPTRLGNLGAAVRCAAAAAAAGLVAVGAHDPWHPEAVRGATGLQFALPVGRLDRPPASDRPLVAIDPAGAPLRPGAIPPRAILAFGHEREGLRVELLAAADHRLAIPMRAGVSSLNLAASVAVALYACRWGARGWAPTARD